MGTKNGGPAYPILVVAAGKEITDDAVRRIREALDGHAGLAMRDYFAARAPPMEAADREWLAREQERLVSLTAAEVAWRWHWADLMLVAREFRIEPPAGVSIDLDLMAELLDAWQDEAGHGQTLAQNRAFAEAFLAKKAAAR